MKLRQAVLIALGLSGCAPDTGAELGDPDRLSRGGADDCTDTADTAEVTPCLSQRVCLCGPCESSAGSPSGLMVPAVVGVLALARRRRDLVEELDLADDDSWTLIGVITMG